MRRTCIKGVGNGRAARRCHQTVGDRRAGAGAGAEAETERGTGRALHDNVAGRIDIAADHTIRAEIKVAGGIDLACGLNGDLDVEIRRGDLRDAGCRGENQPANDNK